MASSKEKAVGLKDAYVAGLLDSAGPEVAAKAGAGALQELAGKVGMERGQIAGDFEDRMVTPTSDNPYGFPSDIRSSDDGGNLPEGFNTWDDTKKSAFFSLPMVDI
jgi:hypothetical protein